MDRLLMPPGKRSAAGSRYSGNFACWEREREREEEEEREGEKQRGEEREGEGEGERESRGNPVCRDTN